MKIRASAVLSTTELALKWKAYSATAETVGRRVRFGRRGGISPTKYVLHPIQVLGHKYQRPFPTPMLPISLYSYESITALGERV
jgi:hypothetical protein